MQLVDKESFKDAINVIMSDGWVCDTIRSVIDKYRLNGTYVIIKNICKTKDGREDFLKRIDDCVGIVEKRALVFIYGELAYKKRLYRKKTK